MENVHYLLIPSTNFCKYPHINFNFLFSLEILGFLGALTFIPTQGQLDRDG